MITFWSCKQCIFKGYSKNSFSQKEAIVNWTFKAKEKQIPLDYSKEENQYNIRISD